MSGGRVLIEVIESNDAYHQSYVAEEVDDLQEEGFEVVEIVRISKKFVGVFGVDVTHIHYEVGG